MASHHSTMLDRVVDMHQRSIARDTIHRLPDMTGEEALRLASYIATIPGNEVKAHWDAIWAGLKATGASDAALSLVARAYQFGYMAALDDIQTERVGI
jgi:hypothetical protein